MSRCMNGRRLCDLRQGWRRHRIDCDYRRLRGYHGSAVGARRKTFERHTPGWLACWRKSRGRPRTGYATTRRLCAVLDAPTHRNRYVQVGRRASGRIDALGTVRRRRRRPWPPSFRPSFESRLRRCVPSSPSRCAGRLFPVGDAHRAANRQGATCRERCAISLLGFANFIRQSAGRCLFGK